MFFEKRNRSSSGGGWWKEGKLGGRKIVESRQIGERTFVESIFRDFMNVKILPSANYITRTEH